MAITTNHYIRLDHDDGIQFHINVDLPVNIFYNQRATLVDLRAAIDKHLHIEHHVNDDVVTCNIDGCPYHYDHYAAIHDAHNPINDDAHLWQLRADYIDALARDDPARRDGTVDALVAALDRR